MVAPCASSPLAKALAACLPCRLTVWHMPAPVFLTSLHISSTSLASGLRPLQYERTQSTETGSMHLLQQGFCGRSFGWTNAPLWDHLYLSAGVQDWWLGARWWNPPGSSNRETLSWRQLNGLWQDQRLLPRAIPRKRHSELLGDRTVVRGQKGCWR